MIKFSKITILLVLLGIVIAGCKRSGEAEQGGAANVELSFAVSASSAARGEDLTRAGGEFLAPDVAFRVVVFNAGDDVSTATPVATGQYVTVGAAGKAIPSTDKDRINLTRGTYDIYFYCPSSADYKDIRVLGDVDFMAGTLLSQDVKADAAGQYVVAVELQRLSSKVYVKIVAQDFHKTMTLGAGGVTISGEADGATYVLGGAGYATLSSTLADIVIPTGEFVAGAPGTLSLTTENGRGVITFPGSPALAVRMNMTLDGVARDLVAELPAGTVLEAGKQHLVTVMITSKGLVDAVTVEVKPWSDGVGESGDGKLEPAVIPTLDYTTTPANCYVTYPKNGGYQPIKFNALKKPIAKYTAGNFSPVNVKGINPSPSAGDAGLENDIVYAEGDVIEVSWQTAVNHGTTGGAANMVVKSIDLGADGIAKVEVNGPGNAVLSYKSGGVILWNYHIWATDSDPFMNHAINVSASGDVNGKADGGVQAGFMDRNLGALATITVQPTPEEAYKYFGMYYQQGHQMPFSGQGVGTVGSVYTTIFDKSGVVMSAGSIGGYTLDNTAVSSVTTAIQNPNTYYSDGSNWFNSTIALWSDYGGNNKSIYDPCPYGYRVPRAGSWEDLTVSNPGAEYSINVGTTWGGNTWWPVAGCRGTGGVIAYIGHSAYYWTPQSGPYGVTSMYFDFQGGTYLNFPYSSRCLGYPVRCVQEGY